MSIIKVRSALETAVNAMTPSLATAWENTPYTPVTGTPYQWVSILFAEPDNTEIGRQYKEQGYMQIKLLYPVGTGSNAANTRADLIRTTFYRGSSFFNGGVTVIVKNTPSIVNGYNEDDRYCLTVKVPFFTQPI
jgi:hypothetical protein